MTHLLLSKEDMIEHTAQIFGWKVGLPPKYMGGKKKGPRYLEPSDFLQ